MSRSDRLLRLLQAMRLMSPPITAAKLAAEMGVSQRSLYRDIDSLRFAGARIDGERGYGYRLVEDQSLPPQTLERTEIEALALGLAEVSRMGDPVLVRAAASVLAKIGATLTDDGEQHLLHAISLVYRPEIRHRPKVDMDFIRSACWREQELAVRYKDKGGVASRRSIWPLAIVYTENVLAILAWCCLRHAFRIFRTDRILEAEFTGRSFRPRRVALLRTYLTELSGKG